MNKIKDDLYEIVGNGGNVAFYLTTEGVILVDDKFDEDHDAIVEKIKTVTNLPVKYVLTTHHHSDHSGGNAKFATSAKIISTVNARANIVGHKQPNAPDMYPARVTLTDQCSVFLGRKKVRDCCFGRGHTNGDAVIYFPADRVLYTGDLMAGKTPLIDYTGGGSIKEWTKTLDGALKLDFDTVIPGHGDPTDKVSLQTYRASLEKLRNRAAELVRKETREADFRKVMETEYGWTANTMQAQWSIPGMMAELKTN